MSKKPGTRSSHQTTAFATGARAGQAIKPTSSSPAAEPPPKPRDAAGRYSTTAQHIRHTGRDCHGR